MTIKEILAEITSQQNHLTPERYPRFQDIIPKKGNETPFSFYPDGSRSFDDIISVFGMITSEGSPLVSILSSFLLRRLAGGIQAYFDNGYLTPPHKHNFVELGYVLEGQFNQQIEGRNYQFNKSDIFIINKDIIHSEFLYSKNSVVLLLEIVNTFFDTSIHHDQYDKDTDEFLHRFITGGKKNYQFARLTSKTGQTQILDLFEKIISELWRPHQGSTHLIIGYVQWILSLLSASYEIEVQWNDHDIVQTVLFEKVRQYLENHYLNTTVADLIKQFGHNRNYFNRLIKEHTGMTYSGFLCNIRLERAELLLKTTGFTVEEIARQTGYENLTYFYRIFQTKFNMTPNELRKLPSQPPPPPHLHKFPKVH
jgi:AraC-like DNA-binding protein